MSVRVPTSQSPTQMRSRLGRMNVKLERELQIDELENRISAQLANRFQTEEDVINLQNWIRQVATTRAFKTLKERLVHLMNGLNIDLDAALYLLASQS